MKTEDGRATTKADAEGADKPAAGASTPAKHGRKLEPSFEILGNFSRVTPAQMASITFPSDGRYQPVRAVSTRTTGSSASAAGRLAGSVSENAGGGGILIMIDQRPYEEADYLEFETRTIHATAVAVPARGDERTIIDRHISLDEDAPEADPPESFEVS